MDNKNTRTVNYYSRTRSRPDWMNSCKPDESRDMPTSSSSLLTRNISPGQLSSQLPINMDEMLRTRSRTPPRAQIIPRANGRNDPHDVGRPVSSSEVPMGVTSLSYPKYERWPHEMPRGSEREAILVRHFIENHYCSNDQAIFIESIMEAVGRMIHIPLRCVMSHADGSVSRASYSFNSITAVPDDRIDRDTMDVLKSASMNSDWSLDLSPRNPGIIRATRLRGDFRVQIVFKSTELFIARTSLSSLYFGLVEPRMVTAICLIREWFHERTLEPLDYLLFVILLRSLMEKRAVPNLLFEDPRNGEVLKDRQIWSKIGDTSIERVRSEWFAEGIRVSRRMKVGEMLDCFFVTARSSLDPETSAIVCPISGKVITEDGKLLYRMWIEVNKCN